MAICLPISSVTRDGEWMRNVLRMALTAPWAAAAAAEATPEAIWAMPERSPSMKAAANERPAAGLSCVSRVRRICDAIAEMMLCSRAAPALNDACMHIEIINTGRETGKEDRERIEAALNGQPTGKHLGLANIVNRLRLIYGESVTIRVDTDTPGQTTVSIIIPREIH